MRQAIHYLAIVVGLPSPITAMQTLQQEGGKI